MITYPLKNTFQIIFIPLSQHSIIYHLQTQQTLVLSNILFVSLIYF